VALHILRRSVNVTAKAKISKSTEDSCANAKRSKLSAPSTGSLGEGGDGSRAELLSSSAESYWDNKKKKK